MLAKSRPRFRRPLLRIVILLTLDILRFIPDADGTVLPLDDSSWFSLAVAVEAEAEKPEAAVVKFGECQKS